MICKKPIEILFYQSNLNAILFEIETEYELHISTWLGYEQHSQQEIAGMADLSYKVFEDVFASSKEDVYALVNHWDLRRDVYMLNQFEAYKNGSFESRIFVDETQEVEKTQISFNTTINAINYKNILRKFLERDYDDENQINSRIFFVHPKRKMYFLYFDSMIMVGSDHLDPIATLFYKYKDYIHPNIKKQFFELLKK